MTNSRRGLLSRSRRRTKQKVLEVLDESAATGRYWFGKYEPKTRALRPEDEWTAMRGGKASCKGSRVRTEAKADATLSMMAAGAPGSKNFVSRFIVAVPMTTARNLGDQGPPIVKQLELARRINAAIDGG